MAKGDTRAIGAHQWSDDATVAGRARQYRPHRRGPGTLVAWPHSGTTPPFLWDHTTRALAPYGAACGTTTARSVAPGGGPSHRSPAGLPLVGRAGLHDAPDGDDERDSQGDIGADEGHGEGRGHDSQGGRGRVGQRSEEGDDGADEGRAHEGGAAEGLDAGAGLSVVHASPPRLACPSDDAARVCRGPWPLCHLR